MISKGDIYLIVVILFLVISALLWRYFTADEGAKAVVTIDGTVKEELKLVKDAEVKIVTAEGYNIKYQAKKLSSFYYDTLANNY